MLAKHLSSVLNFSKALTFSRDSLEVRPGGMASNRRRGGHPSLHVWAIVARAVRPLRVAAAGVCTLLLLGGSVPAHAQSVSFGGLWTQQSPATSPPARYGASMAYDASNGQVVLFGGYGSGYLGDTWTWNGTTWTQQSPATSPPARYGASMAYDASNGQVVLFGGYSSSGFQGDTWTWNGTTWTQQFPAASPPARYLAAMAYDASNGQVVLFGGDSNSGSQGDTWTWNGTTWTQQSPAASPPARYGAAMAYDASNGQVVLFGGQGPSGSQGDTWTWNGTTWTQQSPATSPPARYLAAMAYDASNGQVVLFGGDNSGVSLLGDTWTWNGTTWTQQFPAASPPARFLIAMAYDASNGQVVLFGGANGSGYLGDTWTLQLGSVNFGSANICSGGQTTPAPCSQTLTLNYNVNADTTFATNPTVVTQGAPNLDFTLSSTTCTGTITAGNSCTVNVQFAPLAPGVRMGAVQLVDSSGNLLATTFVQGIGQGPAIAFGPGLQTTVSASGLFYPSGVAMDGAGDVFIADQGNNRVVEVPAGGGAQTTVGSGLITPQGVAVDGAGDVFIADGGNNRVVEVQRSQPPTFSFAATVVLNTSTDSPQSVTVQNIGNQLLDAVPPGLSIGSNSFVQVAGSGTPADCTTSFSLAPGASCNLSVSFIPQTTGSIVSAATFTDNALNAATANQSVTLSGTGLAGTVNVTVGTSPAGLSFTVDGTTYTSSQTLTWTIGTSHTLATTSPQTPTAGTQYTFASWSDSGTTSHSVKASASGF
jgi:Kelch motif/NHL repeat